jgi:16S rRNA (guanine527-N7)-methyltransferase
VSELRSLLEAAGVEAEFLDPLTRYAERVLETNRQFNLTGAKNAQEFVPHLLDSVSIAGRLEGPLVDLGSGGGLPAIPLAIVTGISVTMVETTLKKARFLEDMLAEFGLSGEVIAERAEVAGHHPRLREKFRTGTARAVSSAPTVAELLLPFIEVGGRAVLQRGRLEDRERNALADAALMLGGRVESEIALDGDRRIVIVEKISPTPSKYPRRVGVPEKKPLCY